MRMQTLAPMLGVAVLLAAIGGLTPERLAAQSTGKPIFLALPETFPDVGARVVLVREPTREIVLLDPAGATADELGTGLRLLARLRRDRPEPGPSRAQMIPIVGFAPGPNLTATERAGLESMIEALRSRPTASVGTLGRGRWMLYDESN